MPLTLSCLQPLMCWSRSYASLAGLPIVFGLYGATIPCIIFCLFGSSRQLVSASASMCMLLRARARPYAWGGGRRAEVAEGALLS